MGVRKEATVAAAVESLLASINPNVLPQDVLDQRIMQALSAVATLKSQPASSWRSTYVGLNEMFHRLQHQDEKDLSNSLGSETTDHLRRLLFGPDPGTEALRLLRADAIIAMVEASSPLASAMRADILALITEEKSIVVLDRLRPLASATRG